MVVQGDIVCVTGAAGFIGSWLIKRLLEHGYVVRATIRDPGLFIYYLLFIILYIINLQLLLNIIT